MKKALKITGISVASLIGLLLLAGVLIPVLFKDKIFNLAKNMANEQLNAVVDFKKLDLSVFSNFPSITVTMEDFSVVGVNQFANDTLASASAFKASIDIMAFVKNDIIDLKAIVIDNLNILAKVNADSTANWDITKSTAEAPVAEDSSSAGFNMKIEKFEINNANIIYQDETMRLVAGLQELNFSLKGDLTEKETVLALLSSCKSIDVLYEGTHWIANASMLLDSKIDADMVNSVYTLKETTIELNRIALNADGSIAMKGNDMLIDIKYGAKVSSLKTLLEMIPASILPDVKNVDTKGTMALSGWVKGTYNEKSLPQVWAEMKVENGYIKYTALPKSVDNIGIDATVLFDGNDDSKTLINIPRFHLEIGGNPFDITTRVATPMTDADIKASMNGKMDFASLTDALPLEGIKLAGIMTAGVNFSGRMSAIEKEHYEQLKLDGTIALQKFTVKTADLPVPFDIETAEMEFTPQVVNLKSFNSKLGESDIQLTGKLENFLNYALKDETLKGNLLMTSKYINSNQLMSADSTAAKATPADSSDMTVIVLPSNVDFNINAKIDKLLYDNLTLTNASGGLGLNKGTLNFNNLSAQFAGGQINLTGKYKAEDSKSALVGMNMSLKNVQVKEMVNSFDMLKQALPLLKQVSGKASFNINFTDKLDQNMDPIMMLINATGSFDADSLQLLNAESFSKVMSLVGLKSSSNQLKKIHASFTMKDGKVGINPFGTSIGDTKVMLGGEYGLDESLDAHIDLQLPTAKVSSAINDLADQFAGGLPKIGATTINVGVAVGGTTSNPTYKLAKAKYFGSNTEGAEAGPSVKDQLKDQLNNVAEEKKEEVKDIVKEEVNKQTEDAKNKLKNLFKKR